MYTYLVKKSDYIIAKVKAKNKITAVIKAWAKVNQISNLAAVLTKFGTTKTFLFAELKLGSAGYYLNKEE
tara:strand:+ start:223 stop:432 length:210 start_codon:yes stop_codon:yes gene_type:complete